MRVVGNGWREVRSTRFANLGLPAAVSVSWFGVGTSAAVSISWFGVGTFLGILGGELGG